MPITVEVSAPVSPFVFEGDLSKIAPAPEWTPGQPIKIVPKRLYPRPGQFQEPLVPPQELDPLISRQGEPTRTPDAFTTPILSFQGLGNTGVQPPDTVGDVGPSDYIQAINSGGGTAYKIWDKTGTALTGTLTLSNLGTGACGSGFGDPIVLYDALADRWLLSEFAGSGNNLCVYISKTSDPVAGGWYNYRFTTPNFPDYPKYSVWPDAYYVTSNENSPAVYALDRAKMLLGQAATSQRFTVPSMSGFPFQALSPADFNGSTPPPAGSVAYIGRHRDDESNPPNSPSDYIDLWAFHVDWTTPANSTLTQLPSVTVSEFDSNLCGLSSFSCVPQPGTGVRLDPLREVIMNRLNYRNFGSYEALVGEFATDVGDFQDHEGIRWFELHKVGAGNWTLFQEGTYSPNATHHWMASIAMDRSGNMALGYSKSDATSTFPGVAYTGRLATDAPGTMSQPETTLVAGSAAQTSGTRWGDYSAMGIDPADDCTFWYTQEYTPSGSWRTWIGSFKFSTCGAASTSGVDYVVGQGLAAPNGNAVRVYNNLGIATATNFTAYGANGYGTNVSSGDINGGTTAEILTGPGPGPVYGPQVRAFQPDGTPINKVNFYAYGTLKYGVNVASGSLDADAFDEIISGAGPGVVFGPHVRGWNFDNVALTAIAKVSYFAYATLAYGVNIEEGDLDNDNFSEILTGPGPSPAFGSQIRGWNVDGGIVSSISKINFNAFTLIGYGTNVAGGSVDADPFAEIAAAPGPGPTHPTRFLGFNYDNASITPLAGFDVTPYGTPYGGRVNLGDLDADGTADLVCGPGPAPGAAATVRGYVYSGGALTARTGTPFVPFTTFYGVNVAVGALGL
ncbi:MAG: hypothetical protein U0166_22060 [Acidobacteriota bacterium]